MSAQRFAFVGLIGRPNAGKSTLLNTLVGQKISIVTHKVQTTRNRLLGLCIHRHAQLAFIDTPGIFEKKNQYMLTRIAQQAMVEADLLCVLVDSSGYWKKSISLLDQALQTEKPVFLLLNKIDKLPKEKLLEIAAILTDKKSFTDVLMLSGRTGDGVTDLKNILAARAAVSSWYFDPDEVTDLPLKQWAAEMTREVLFKNIHQEIPYGITIEPEKWEDTPKALIIYQVIMVTRTSHKHILLGANTLKRIGTQTRLNISKELKRPVHLFLHVKVKHAKTHKNET